MLVIKNLNNKYIRYLLAGSALALAFGSFFLYIGWSRQRIPVYVPPHFSSPQALVDRYVEGIEALEAAYILGDAPITIDAIVFRLTEMRVPQEMLEIHLRGVLSLEKMKQTPLSLDVQKKEVGELFTRLKTGARTIGL